MSAKILELPQRSATGLWLDGKARCSVCQHEWIAVVPKGTDWIECPKCRLMKARFLHPAMPKVGNDVWACACGCDVFRITRTSAYCINCATEQAF